MAKSGTQTGTGKAFEFACAKAIVESDKMNSQFILDDSPQMRTAKNFFDSLDPVYKDRYLHGAQAAIRILSRLEPCLYNGNGMLKVSLQTDAEGIDGDVRDVVCLRASDGWEIGLSCKHNHDAVKHSRLSNKIDFGKEWFGIPCSKEYFTAVGKVFDPLSEMRAESKNKALWSDIPDKEGDCYVPVLNAFIKELKQLDAENPKIIPAALIRYLMGRKDFYKVIMNENGEYTEIDSVNMQGTLGKPAGRLKPLVPAPLMTLPTKFYEIGYKEGSNNTIIVVCDNGWNVSMRIHNASSKVEPSLKFDVRLFAMPSSILKQIEPWGMV